MAVGRRREFLKSVAAAAAAAGFQEPADAARNPSSSPSAPARHGLFVSGAHGYTLEPGVCAGDAVDFCISSDSPYRLTVHRLGPEVDSPESDPCAADAGAFPARPHAIRPGSFIHISRRIRGVRRALTVEAWVRPWSLDRLQGVVTQEDKQDDRGFALGLGKNGYVGFFLGDGRLPEEATIHRTPVGVVSRGRWIHLAATWDGKAKRIWVDGREFGPWPYESVLDPGPHPLRLGAMGEWGAALRMLDGDLAQPAVYGRALGGEEVLARLQARALTPPGSDALLGFWPLDEERGETVADRSPSRRHGRIVNLGTWRIGGPSSDGAAPRFGPANPPADPGRGHGLRLASDDLYDCEWPVTWRWRVPTSARSGLYAARLRLDSGAPAAEIAFVVRRPRRAAREPLLVLASANTWRAYNAAPFGVWPSGNRPVIGTDGLPNPPGGPPAYSLYRGHAAGQGTLQVGWRLPCPVADSRVRYGGPSDYSHLVRGERWAHRWLERTGYRFETAPDRDLDREPGLLEGRRCVMLNGHSEYWSTPMLDALEAHLARGGALIVLSGNSLFWRVSFRSDGRVMECRKVDAPGFQIPPERRAEAWHSDDGRRGGMLRECGRPGWRLTGLDSLGWNNHADPAAFGPYRVTRALHPLFREPRNTGVADGDALGVSPEGAPCLANGHEVDVRVAALGALSQAPPPPGGAPPSEPAGIETLAQGEIAWERGGASFDYFFRPSPAGRRGADMIYWERPAGGRVFNAGSIGAGWALAHDPKFQILLGNVLDQFGVRPLRGR